VEGREYLSVIRRIAVTVGSIDVSVGHPASSRLISRATED
jgi:hypothetical protein